MFEIKTSNADSADVASIGAIITAGTIRSRAYRASETGIACSRCHSSCNGGNLCATVRSAGSFTIRKQLPIKSASTAVSFKRAHFFREAVENDGAGFGRIAQRNVGIRDLSNALGFVRQ